MRWNAYLREQGGIVAPELRGIVERVAERGNPARVAENGRRSVSSTSRTSSRAGCGSDSSTSGALASGP